MNRLIRISARLVTLITCIGAADNAPGALIHGRFLPAAPKSQVFQYGQGAISFDRDVTARNKDKNVPMTVGRITFDYSTFTADPDGTGAGGAALSGGFYMYGGNGVSLKPGFSLGWVQTIISDRTGPNDWNLPALNAGEFPDADTNSPAYPFATAAVIPANGGAPTLGFQDFAQRGFGGAPPPGNLSWTAELGLTCISNTPTINMDGMMFREVRVIDSFLWGFNLNGQPVPIPGVPGIGNVGANAPAGWGNPTAGFLNTLNGFYDGMGGGGGTANGGAAVASMKFKFFNNDNCFVPEPATLSMLFLIVLARRRAGR